MSLNLDTGPAMPGLRPWHHAARPLGLMIAPLLLAQGRMARAKRGRLPNAPLPWSGTINGPRPLQMVGLGDSTIAGVGVDNPMLSLSPQVAKGLYGHTGRGIVWDSYGERGITTGQLLENYLPQALDEHDRIDIAVISIGANDAKNLLSAQTAVANMVSTVDRVHAHSPDALVVVSSLPAFHLFDSLAQPLRSVIAGHGQAIDRRVRPLVESRRYALMLPPPDHYPQGFFASDGFHPSPEGYRTWAQFVIEHLVGRGGLQHLMAR